ncbi:MAG: tRNA lysidine(34) synthetase TilS [Burkholderiaceae bacterium]
MPQTFASAMAQFAPVLPLAVAYSGGADSSALLLACAQKWPGQVSAIHVHHGLQAAAEDFALHCQTTCTRWQVPLVVQRVDARPAAGESPENAARAARFKAFSAVASDLIAGNAIKSVALAHHADDQVETLLLALSRGAGLPGLAAMPMQWHSGGMAYHRPLLEVAGSELREWLGTQGETWVEDPSNQNQDYTRNRIRQQLLPALAQAFPAFRSTFARSSRHAAQAQALLAEVAQQDLAQIGSPPEIAALKALSAARQANVLRHWLTRTHCTTPSTAQLGELLAQLRSCTTRGHAIHIKVGAGLVLREGAHLHYAPIPSA